VRNGLEKGKESIGLAGSPAGSRTTIGPAMAANSANRKNFVEIPELKLAEKKREKKREKPDYACRGEEGRRSGSRAKGNEGVADTKDFRPKQ